MIIASIPFPKISQWTSNFHEILGLCEPITSIHMSWKSSLRNSRSQYYQAKLPMVWKTSHSHPCITARFRLPWEAEQHKQSSLKLWLYNVAEAIPFSRNYIANFDFFQAEQDAGVWGILSYDAQCWPTVSRSRA